MEAVEFNGLLDEFEALDTQVIGASVDSKAANQKFAEKFGLRMPLICDTEHEVSIAFGVVDRLLLGRAKRTTFLISPDGRVERVFKSVKAKGHALTVLEAARKIWSG